MSAVPEVTPLGQPMTPSQERPALILVPDPTLGLDPNRKIKPAPGRSKAEDFDMLTKMIARATEGIIFSNRQRRRFRGFRQYHRSFKSGFGSYDTDLQLKKFREQEREAQEKRQRSRVRSGLGEITLQF